jgi:hypothetical protein
MYKIKDITKKNLKQTMVISAIVTMLLVSLGSLPAMKSYALDFSGLIPSFGSHGSHGSHEKNIGSIDTDSFASCLGIAVDCTNTNRDNNNPTTTAASVTPGGNPDFTACATCFTQSLNPTQLANVKGLAGLSIDASNDALCHVVAHMTASQLHAIIVAPVVGVTSAVADTIIQCLIDAGFTNLST